jgi:hypothetical protein
MKMAAKNSKRSGPPIDLRGVEDQRVRDTPYPASNAQSVNCNPTGQSISRLKPLPKGIKISAAIKPQTIVDLTGLAKTSIIAYLLSALLFFGEAQVQLLLR